MLKGEYRHTRDFPATCGRLRALLMALAVHRDAAGIGGVVIAAALLAGCRAAAVPAPRPVPVPAPISAPIPAPILRSASETVVIAEEPLANGKSAQARRGYTDADVVFMRGMIAHHAQAITMAAFVPSRTTRPSIRVLAERLDISQQDEIAVMRRWLAERKEAVPEAGGGHDNHAMSHAADGLAMMPGMLTALQLSTLATLEGPAFERMFLQRMIQHHEGALQMVGQLLATNGAAQEPQLYQFVSDVDTDQRAEIRRMRALLGTL